MHLEKQDIFQRPFQPHKSREGKESLDKVQFFTKELILLYESPHVVFIFLLVLPSPPPQRLSADGHVSRVSGGRPRLCVRERNLRASFTQVKPHLLSRFLLGESVSQLNDPRVHFIE